jgi:acetyltransferase-like isoleucine patch superfamily enzyme
MSPESYLIDIGDNVVITENVFLITHEGSICVFHNENPKLDLFGTIKIGNNCFIGMNSLILPNTTIGNNCIVGAGSVVRGKIPDNSVVSGNPAKVIRTMDEYRQKVFSNPTLFEYKTLSEEDKKRILLEKFNLTH